MDWSNVSAFAENVKMEVNISYPKACMTTILIQLAHCTWLNEILKLYLIEQNEVTLLQTTQCSQILKEEKKKETKLCVEDSVHLPNHKNTGRHTRAC